MPGPNATIANNRARALLAKFPKIASLTAAKMLAKDFPKTFTVESARSVIRHIRGAKGEWSRTQAIDKTPRPAEDAETCRRFGALLPAPVPPAFKWVDLPDGPGKWLVMSDLHVPYHDNAAIHTAVKYGRRVECDGLLLLGDVVDFSRLSRFEKDPEARDVVEEIEDTRKMLDALQIIPWKRIVYKEGNHDNRVERYIMAKAEELYGLSSLTLPSLLKLNERGILWVPKMQFLKHGALSLLHGDELPGSSPVNPARGALLQAISCVVVAHHHRASSDGGSTLRSEVLRAWSIGCMCDLHPRYRPVNRWTHGFATVDVSGDMWKVENFQIVKGEVCPG